MKAMDRWQIINPLCPNIPIFVKIRHDGIIVNARVDRALRVQVHQLSQDILCPTHLIQPVMYKCEFHQK
jgi:hypothetical protein